MDIRLDKLWLAMVHSDKPWLTMVHLDKLWPMMCDDAILICLYVHRRPSIMGVYHCFILRPSAFKQHYCNQMSRKNEEIMSWIMYTCTSTYSCFIRNTPFFISHEVTMPSLRLSLWIFTYVTC